MDNQTLDYPWDVLAELQARERSITKIGPWAEAHRDKLDYVVDLIVSGNVPDRETLARRLRNVEINHQKTHKRRRQMDAASLAVVPARSADAIVNAVVAQDLVALARSLTASYEWTLIWALAEDATYSDLSSRTGLSISALKTRTSRCRSRIRSHLVAA
jgi:uncharacterized protein YerC